ncbi:MAG: efflux RND transporter periplasmic adaptor subunit [Phycisphaerales bacterium]|nr:MAG: efflux RND transporter periplasmic adaptor subunit [Phycisphaerales bacterium]
MAGNKRTPRILGVMVGIVLVAVAVYSVVYLDWTREVPPEPSVVRPLKTMIIAEPFSAAGRKYPGKVAANEEVNLAFQVSGQLVEVPVRKGQDVAQGELLARLDSRDFENTLATKQAALTSARADYERIKGLAERGMAADKETIDAKAAYDAAVAEMNIAQKALDDTRLSAPFAGVIADTFVDNFQNVSAKQSILSLQDVASVEIVVNVPEERVVRSKKGEERYRYRFVATFEYLADREFEVAFKEFSTEADSATQMYEATFVMSAPEDASILPGMTVTVREYLKTPEPSETIAYAVPIEAVPIDDQGNYFVWVVNDTADGTATVHRANVTVGEMIQDDILILEGLSGVERIALAGVHLLQEGQQVRPFLAKGDTSP